MRKSTLAALALVLIFLAASAALLWNLSLRETNTALASPDIPAKAEKIVISGPKGNLAFSRFGSSWRMISPVDYEADSAALAGILNKLPAIRLSASLSDDPSAYGLFGLDVSSRTNVKIFTPADKNKPALDFDAGKEGAAIDSFYMRFAGAIEVLEAGGLSSMVFLKTAGDWLDKRVTSFKQEDVTAVAVNRAGGGFEISRNRGVWEIRQAGKSRALSTSTVAEAVSPVLAALSGLEAESVIPADPPGFFSSPEMTITVETRDGPVIIKEAKSEDKAYRYLETDKAKSVYFMIPEWKLAPLKKSPKNFR